MVSRTLSGGAKLEEALKKIAAKVSKASKVNIGFLEGASYPDGTPVAMVAAINEWGATIHKGASIQTIYRQVNKAGTQFNKKGKFVKKAQSNFASDHEVAAHDIVIPPRPFFRGMIANKSPEWPDAVSGALKANDYDAKAALKAVGLHIKEQLQESIRDFSDPPNAPSTIAKKGFNKPLIDTSVMLNSADYEVE